MDQRKLRPQDVRCTQDLAKLPVLSKEIIRTNFREMLASNVSELKVSWCKTGGTTGEPIQVCRDRKGSAWENMCLERGLRWGGLSPDEPRISLFGGSLGIDKTRLTTRLGRMFRRDLLFPAFDLRIDTAPHLFDTIRRSECRFLIGYASAIYRLAQLAVDLNQKCTFDAVFPTAELLLPEWEGLIRRVFHCAILPYYGCGEVNSLGFQTPNSNYYFIPEEHAIIEIMQSDGSTHLSGDGAFLITDLDNYVMPILRYANGDAGKVSFYSKDDLPYNHIERLDGRYNSLLMADTGDLISGVIGTHIFRHLQSVESYRVIQEEPLRIVINIVPKTNFCEADVNLITRLFARYLGEKMKITVEKVHDIPRPPSGKSIFVINRCLSTPSPP
jgi:phenylacetate-CoA ligase